MDRKESWRIVPSMPDIMASSIGRLMVIPRLASMPHGGERQYGGEPTLGQWDGDRMIYQLRGHTHKVARLVCEAFSGPPPFDGAVCMHIDENSRNNSPTNLKWGTQKENLNAPGYVARLSARARRNAAIRYSQEKAA